MFFEVMKVKKEKKPVFYKELSYVAGLVIMAFAAALTELADFSMSMVVAPAYILHLKLSEIWPWFSFGVAEYCVQGLLVVITVIAVRRFKLSYLFSFITALLYGTLLDGAMAVVAFLPHEGMALRILWFAAGTVLCSLAVSLFFHTYISPEAYELIVKEIAQKFSFNINKTKTVFDCISTLVAIVLSFCFFGFGVFRGVGIGTILCALINGFLIGRFSVLLEKCFAFKNRFDLEKYF